MRFLLLEIYRGFGCSEWEDLQGTEKGRKAHFEITASINCCQTNWTTGKSSIPRSVIFQLIFHRHFLKGIPCTLEKTALLNRPTSHKWISEIDLLCCQIHTYFYGIFGCISKREIYIGTCLASFIDIDWGFIHAFAAWKLFPKKWFSE